MASLSNLDTTHPFIVFEKSSRSEWDSYDERSYTTEDIAIHTFKDEASLKIWLKYAQNKTYKVIKVQPVEVQTEVMVTVK